MTLSFNFANSVANTSAASNITTEHEYRAMFDLAPVSLWLEDYSDLNAFFTALRAEGVGDLSAYLAQNPHAVQECAQRIKVIAVNQRTLDLYNARDIDHLRDNFNAVFGKAIHKSLELELLALWRGALAFTNRNINYSLDARRIDVMVHGRVMPGSESTWQRVMVAVEDITDRIKAETHLDFLATHDALTLVRNRAFYNSHAARLERQGPFPITITVLDLNGLKQVNNQFGHEAGDALLRRAGAVLKDAAGSVGTAARLGGDEFVILWPRTDAMQLAAYEARLDALIKQDNRGGHSTRLNFASGSAVCELGGRLDLTERAADLRMAEAKRVYYATHDRRRSHLSVEPA